MSDRDTPKKQVNKPREWDVLGATFWSVVAFFAPQFALAPLIILLDQLIIDHNAKIFLLQGLAELTTLGLLWLVIHKVYHSKFATLGLTKFNPGLLGWVLLAFPVYLVTSELVSKIVGGLLLGIDLQQEQDIGYSNPNGYELALIFVALVVLAPLIEEILFRGFLFRAFRKSLGFWAGAIGVSMLFALAHGQANVGIDVFVLSMFLCYLREKTGTLWTAIALHSLKNLVAFIVLFMMKVS